MTSKETKGAYVVSFAISMSICVLWILALGTCSFVFPSTLVGTGPAEYAETYDPASFLKMPFNALVNAGYIIVSIYWLYRQSVALLPWRDHVDLMFFYAMTVAYAAVQFVRIVTQDWHVGLVDQWLAFPFYVWIMIKCDELLKTDGTFHSPLVHLRLQLASSSLFFLCAWYPSFFEGLLVIHILLTVWCCYLVKQAYQCSSVSFYGALLACNGFVFLKYYDHTLATAHPFFTVWTGHFWSKIADALQVHFVSCFLEEAFLKRECVQRANRPSAGFGPRLSCFGPLNRHNPQ